MDIHPSQYQSPLTDVSPSKQAAAVQYMNPQQDRSTGKRVYYSLLELFGY